jgi:hypothetical protein
MEEDFIKDYPFEAEYFTSTDFLRKKVKRKFFLFCHLFKRAVIERHRIAFLNIRMCEDVPFLAAYISHSKKIMYVDLQVYYYYNRPGSLVNSFNLKHATDIITAYSALYALLPVHSGGAKFKAYYNRLIITQIIYIFRKSKDLKNNEERKALADVFKKSALSGFKIVWFGISLRKILLAIKIKYGSSYFPC